MITNVYVDGFNLYYGCLKGTPYKWLDLDALCKTLLPKDTIKRIRYFTARVSERADDPGAPIRQSTYLRALDANPHISIHLGEFYVTRPRMPLAHPPANGPRTVQVIKTEEKGSDVNIATYLMLDACRNDSEAAVVITNDSDLREPLRVVREELGLTVGVINPQQPMKRSRVITASFFKQIREPALRKCQLPNKLTGQDGRLIHKPNTW